MSIENMRDEHGEGEATPKETAKENGEKWGYWAFRPSDELRARLEKHRATIAKRGGRPVDKVSNNELIGEVAVAGLAALGVE